MSALVRLADVVYWLALAAWIAALGAAGIAAMNVFPATDAMSMRLERYADFPAERHARLAAGEIMAGVFHVVDVLQIVAVPAVLVALGVQTALGGRSLRRPAHAVRAACLALAAAGFAYHATTLAPVMNRELRAVWSAAEAGDVERADAHRAAFEARHPTADALLRMNLVLLLVAAGASAVAWGAPAPPAPALEPPALARR